MKNDKDIENLRFKTSLLQKRDLARDIISAVENWEENPRNFIVTGLPRSGTKFLSQAISKYSNLNAAHDRSAWMFYKKDKIGNPRYVGLINRRLRKSNYGEICGGFRMHLEQFNAARKNIIVRDPHDVWLSHANMNGPESLRDRDLEANLLRIEHLRSYCHETISFRQMTTSTVYLEKIIRNLGASVVEIPQEVVNKKVNTRKLSFKNLNDLPIWLNEKIFTESKEIRHRWTEDGLI